MFSLIISCCQSYLFFLFKYFSFFIAVFSKFSHHIVQLKSSYDLNRSVYGLFYIVLLSRTNYMCKFVCFETGIYMFIYFVLKKTALTTIRWVFATNSGSIFCVKGFPRNVKQKKRTTDNNLLEWSGVPRWGMSRLAYQLKLYFYCFSHFNILNVRFNSVIVIIK